MEDVKEEMKMNKLSRTIVERKGAVSQVTLASDVDHEEPQITIDETDPDKKVRYKESDVRVMRNKKRVGSFERDNLGVRNRRLILYQEICV